MVRSSSLKIVWDVEALNQLKEILTYLEEQSGHAPKVVKTSLIERLKLIKDNPLSFEIDKLKNPLNKDFRAFFVYSYRVTYQINFAAKEIRILRIRHTSREPRGY